MIGKALGLYEEIGKVVASCTFPVSRVYQPALCSFIEFGLPVFYGANNITSVSLTNRRHMQKLRCDLLRLLCCQNVIYPTLVLFT